MHIKEYISEVSKYKRVQLGNTEKYFLNEIIVGGQKSAYNLFSILKSHSVRNSMEYKNVYKRVKRLQELNLIEEAEDAGNNNKSKRGSIYYKLTSFGLFYVIAELVQDLSVNLREILGRYGDSIIFESLLYPYFEKDTLMHASTRLYFAIIQYLQECCYTTLKMCDSIQAGARTIAEENKDASIKQLEVDLQWYVRSLAFKLVTKNDEFYRHITLTSEDRIKIYDHSQRASISILTKDKRFMQLLKMVAKEFEDGYNEIMIKGKVKEK